MQIPVKLRVYHASDGLTMFHLEHGTNLRHRRTHVRETLRNWCDEQFSGDDWNEFADQFWFSDNGCAMAFKMRWHGATIEME